MATNVAERIEERIAAAKVELAALAAKEAAGNMTGADEATLPVVLVTAGCSADDFQRLVDLHRRHTELSRAQQETDINALGAAMVRARRVVAEYEQETREIIERRNAEQRPLNEAAVAAVRALDAAQSRTWEIGEMEYMHAEALGIEQPELDRCQLVKRGEKMNRNTLGDGPELIVPAEVFAREKRRRFNIWRLAVAERSNDHQRDAFNGYKAGKYNQNRPSPDFVEPTWADIAADPEWLKRLEKAVNDEATRVMSRENARRTEALR